MHRHSTLPLLLAAAAFLAGYSAGENTNSTVNTGAANVNTTVMTCGVTAASAACNVMVVTAPA